MGVKERQERDREQVRGRILDAARELFVAEGYRNVSIRKIAEKVEYSPAALYSYFPSKDDLFFALAEEGFRKLFEFTNDPAVTTGDPLTAIRHGFLRYYEFSRAHPEYFELMFVDRSVPKISHEWEGFGFVEQMIDEVRAVIKRGIDAGPVPVRHQSGRRVSHSVGGGSWPGDGRGLRPSGARRKPRRACARHPGGGDRRASCGHPHDVHAIQVPFPVRCRRSRGEDRCVVRECSGFLR